MANKHRVGRPTNKELARRVNVQAFGRSDSNEDPRQLARYAMPITPQKRDFGKVLAYLDAALVEAGEKPNPRICITSVKTFKKLVEIAMREAVENLDVYKCDGCGEMFEIHCTECGKPNSIKMPSREMEKNSLAALKILSDKLAPNLASVSMEVDVNVVVTNITEVIKDIINVYVPNDKRMECMSVALTKIGNIGNMVAIEEKENASN